MSTSLPPAPDADIVERLLSRAWEHRMHRQYRAEAAAEITRLRAELASAVLAEREACAALCEQIAEAGGKGVWRQGRDCADAIRAQTSNWAARAKQPPTAPAEFRLPPAKPGELPIFHLRQYGDVTQSQMDAYVAATASAKEQT